MLIQTSTNGSFDWTSMGINEPLKERNKTEKEVNENKITKVATNMNDGRA